MAGGAKNGAGGAFGNVHVERLDTGQEHGRETMVAVPVLEADIKGWDESMDAELQLRLAGPLSLETTAPAAAVAGSARRGRGVSGLAVDDFELLNVLGRGAYGTVFLVRKHSNRRLYAMKVLRRDQIKSEKDIHHTKAERTVLAGVTCPFVVRLRYAFRSKRKLFLIMEYVNGGELFTRLATVNSLVEDDARFYAAEVVVALEYLHGLGILYRDLKPENILIGEDGHIRLTDFGFAKGEVDDDVQTRTFCGTVQYMAPEQVQRAGHGKAADWWALGVLIHEMVTGQTPFQAGNRKKIQQNIMSKKISLPNWLSASCRSLLKGLLNRIPDKRLGAEGAEQIRSHKFFEGIDWDKVRAKQLKPPYIPTVSSPFDVSNFDKKVTDEPAFVSGSSNASSSATRHVKPKSEATLRLDAAVGAVDPDAPTPLAAWRQQGQTAGAGSKIPVADRNRLDSKESYGLDGHASLAAAAAQAEFLASPPVGSHTHSQFSGFSYCASEQTQLSDGPSPHLGPQSGFRSHLHGMGPSSPFHSPMLLSHGHGMTRQSSAVTRVKSFAAPVLAQASPTGHDGTSQVDLQSMPLPLDLGPTASHTTFIAGIDDLRADANEPISSAAELSEAREKAIHIQMQDQAALTQTATLLSENPPDLNLYGDDAHDAELNTSLQGLSFADPDAAFVEATAPSGSAGFGSSSNGDLMPVATASGSPETTRKKRNRRGGRKKKKPDGGQDGQDGSSPVDSGLGPSDNSGAAKQQVARGGTPSGSSRKGRRGRVGGK